MTSNNLSVAGIRFRTQTDYEAALRDQKKIDFIRQNTNLEDFEQVETLYRELLSGSYKFETIVGNNFDDEIFEIIQKNKGKVNRLKEKKNIEPEKPLARKNKRNSGKKPREDKVELSEELNEQVLLELRKMEKRRKWIVILASLLAVASIGYVIVYYTFSVKTSINYKELASLKGSRTLNKTVTEENVIVHRVSMDTPDILDEYMTLYEKNKKLIGWLQIDDTKIDYPVMQTVDNEYYLEHNFNQEYDKNGSLFLDRDCSIYPQSTNLIIYGHHMKSGTMFGSLQKYAKEDYYQKHKKISFDTIYEKGTYEVAFVFYSKVYNEDDLVFKYYQFINANSAAEFDSYISEMRDMSLYQTGIKVNYGDSLLTLSTCDQSQEDGRFVVVAKKTN